MSAAPFARVGDYVEVVTPARSSSGWDRHAYPARVVERTSSRISTAEHGPDGELTHYTLRRSGKPGVFYRHVADWHGAARILRPDAVEAERAEEIKRLRRMRANDLRDWREGLRVRHSAEARRIEALLDAELDNRGDGAEGV